MKKGRGKDMWFKRSSRRQRRQTVDDNTVGLKFEKGEKSTHKDANGYFLFCGEIFLKTKKTGSFSLKDPNRAFSTAYKEFIADANDDAESPVSLKEISNAEVTLLTLVQ